MSQTVGGWVEGCLTQSHRGTGRWEKLGGPAEPCRWQGWGPPHSPSEEFASPVSSHKSEAQGRRPWVERPKPQPRVRVRPIPKVA